MLHDDVPIMKHQLKHKTEILQQIIFQKEHFTFWWVGFYFIINF